MKDRIIKRDDYAYILVTWVETVDYDEERCCYEWWYQYDAKTGKFLRSIFITTKDSGDTPETVSWDFSTEDLQRAEEWYYGEQYKVYPY